MSFSKRAEMRLTFQSNNTDSIELIFVNAISYTQSMDKAKRQGNFAVLIRCYTEASQISTLWTDSIFYHQVKFIIMSTVLFFISLTLAVVISASLIIVLIYNLRPRKKSKKLPSGFNKAGNSMENQTNSIIGTYLSKVEEAA